MLARLSQHNRARYEEPRAVALRSLAENVVAIKGQQHPVILSGDAVVQVMADPVRLEQILNHLVQNAIDASTPANPVTMRLEIGSASCRENVCQYGMVWVGAVS